MERLFFIIAGEASGDLLGSKLIKEIKQIQPNTKFIGIGGELMKKAGLEAIFGIEELSVMGFLEVLPHIPKLLRRIAFTANKIADLQPEFLITIDAPDFCFRVAKRLKSRFNPVFSKTKKIHLIAPSVWAYRPKRAQKIAKLYDLLLAIMPFEPPYFEKHGLKTRFIGHPLLDEIPDFAQQKLIREEFRKLHGLKESDILLALTPGSRKGEITRIFPEFIEATNQLARTFSRIKPLIFTVEKTRQKALEMAKNFEVEPIFISQKEKSTALLASDYGMAKSGTNAVEMSLHKLPIIVAYKVNFLTYWLLRLLVKIKFANLLNLVVNHEIIPELLQNKCYGDAIAAKIAQFIQNQDLANQQIKNVVQALEIVGLGKIKNPMQKGAEEILSL